MTDPVGYANIDPAENPDLLFDYTPMLEPEPGPFPNFDVCRAWGADPDGDLSSYQPIIVFDLPRTADRDIFCARCAKPIPEGSEYITDGLVPFCAAPFPDGCCGVVAA